MNAGDNVNYQNDYGFTQSYFKVSPIVIDDYLKKKSEYETRKFETPNKN